MTGTRKDDDYKRGAFIGKNNTGKSTVVIDMVRKSYDPNTHRVLLICDTDPKAYTGITRLYTYDELKNFKCGIAKFFDYKCDPAQMIENIIAIIREGQDTAAKPLQNGAIVFDDCSNYIRTNPPVSVTTFLGNHRMYHLDLFFTVHSIKDLPSLLRRRMSFFTVFKTLDSFQSHKRLESLDYPNAENLYKAWVKVMNDPSEYSNMTIKTGQ